MTIELEYSSKSDSPIAEGAEAKIYTIRNRPRELLKLYIDNKDVIQKREKLNYLVNNRPLLSSHLAWPLEYYESTTVSKGQLLLQQGFYMKKIEGLGLEYLESLSPPHQLLKLQPNLNRKGIKDLLSRLMICCNIGETVNQLYDAGYYTIVDVRPQNFIMDNSGQSHLIDLDSIQIWNDDIKIQSPSYSPEYAPKSNYKAEEISKNKSWDIFGLSIIAYKILFGIHPFAGMKFLPFVKVGTTLPENIDKKLYAYGEQSKYLLVRQIPHLKMRYIPEPLQVLFYDIFSQTNDYTIHTWKHIFLMTYNELAGYNQLKVHKIYSNHQSQNTNPELDKLYKKLRVVLKKEQSYKLELLKKSKYDYKKLANMYPITAFTNKYEESTLVDKFYKLWIYTFQDINTIKLNKKQIIDDEGRVLTIDFLTIQQLNILKHQLRHIQDAIIAKELIKNITYKTEVIKYEITLKIAKNKLIQEMADLVNS